MCGVTSLGQKALARRTTLGIVRMSVQAPVQHFPGTATDLHRRRRHQANGDLYAFGYAIGNAFGDLNTFGGLNAFGGLYAL
jgi:hypothetical protein